MKLAHRAISVLCVDDNDMVADALRARLQPELDMQWLGRLGSADDLVAAVRRLRPDVVVLDIDMPGRSAFEALEEVQRACPETRTLMFSGLVRRDLVDRAIDAGAWGYLAKREGAEELLSAIRQVASGCFVLGRDVAACFDRRG